MPTAEDVASAYRFFLGREPEDANVVERHLGRAASIAELRARFLASPEFYRRNSRELLRYLAIWEARKPGNAVEVACQPEQLGQIFAHIQQVWSSLGDVEPHFSVVSTPNYKPENLQENLAAFYRSGRAEVELLAEELAGHGLPASGYQRCIELGCGVGRVTRFLANLATSVVGFDVSKPHLALAEGYLHDEQVANAELRLIEAAARFEPPPCDLLYSRIVLQHNPPPVMHFLLRRLLAALQPGGVAVFQLPTYIEGYGFSVDDYIDRMGSLDNQEVHALPQRAVFDALAEAGCEVLNVYRDNSLSRIEQVSNRFVVRRR